MIYVVIVAALLGFALFQVLYTRSHARRLAEHDCRMDRIYGIERDEEQR